MTAKQFGPKGWSPDRLPDLSDTTYVITGGNSGIGYEAARMLGEKGARVTILSRNEDKARAAVQTLKAKAPAGTFDFVRLDLASLASVREAADAVRAKHAQIDALVNNAGLMMIPNRQLTEDGFEMQFGVNHLGHFALSGLLSDVVEASGGRFVSLASVAHKYARGLRFDDLMFDRGYRPVPVYCHSKLADLVFSQDLNRRLEQHGKAARAVACHPGYSATNLQSTGPGGLMATMMKPMTAVFSQSAVKGAVPTVLCAAGAEADAGAYYGPTGFQDFSGPVDRAAMTRAARDAEAGEKLWTASEELTGVSWPIFEKATAA